MRFFNLFLALFFTGLISGVYAGPMINVGSLNEYILPQSNTLAKRIHNTGDTTAFVRVVVSEILFNRDGTTTEKAIDVGSVVAGQSSGLISSPPRLIIPANGRQTNRLLFVGDRDNEHYYRVRYIPVVPTDVNEFGLTDEILKEYKHEVNTKVTVLTGFGTIVTVQPKQSTFDTQVTSKRSNILRLHNHGNASVMIKELRSCEADTANCSAPVNVQLRPGKTLERTAPENQVWAYILIEGSNKKFVNGNPS